MPRLTLAVIWVPIAILWALAVFVLDEPVWPTRLLIALVASSFYAFTIWTRTQRV